MQGMRIQLLVALMVENKWTRPGAIMNAPPSISLFPRADKIILVDGQIFKIFKTTDLLSAII